MILSQNYDSLLDIQYFVYFFEPVSTQFYLYAKINIKL